MNKPEISEYLIEKRPKTLQINDLAALFCGDKKVVYTATQDQEDEERVKELCDRFKFKLLIMKEKGKNVFNQNHTDILIGTDTKRMEEAKKLFLENRLKEWGIYLDYPECCVESYSEWDYKESLIAYIFSKTKIKTKTPFYINNITNFYSRTPDPRKRVKILFKNFLEKNKELFSSGMDFEPIITWHPCSYNCKESIKRGEKIYEFMEKHIPERAKIRKELLSGIFIFKDDFEFLAIKGEIKAIGKNISINIKKILPWPKTFFKKEYIFAIKKTKDINLYDWKILNPKQLKDLLVLPFS
ncbi:MAG: hypothetical protein N2Z60_04605 [Elusimicrobiales bacterium]|nr:hypothetical protein [Elusimicrobiales bacterium]HOJ86413.1 hypothetical protein [Elusimicrobiales bacterium]HOL62091.1 hypothetical protein [Elusimicrobiales bacterium]HPO94419.1 hypothetical protein [Elusimicrobiales bacterium]